MFYRATIQLLFQDLNRSRVSMAVNKQFLLGNCCGFCHIKDYKQGSRTQFRRYPVDVSLGGLLSSTTCLGGHNGIPRRRDDVTWEPFVMTTRQQGFHDPETSAVKEVGSEMAHGNALCGPLKPLGTPGYRNVSSKLNVAVDVDEVLGSFLSALNKFIADHYSLNHSLSEYYVYEFFKIWKCSRLKADERVHEFFKTSYFQEGIHPIPGARVALQKLSSFCNLSIVTSRQNAIKDHTIQWIEKHYPGLFEEIHFGNHFALAGQSRQKSEICRSLGAQVLIDDNPRYALECANAGIQVLLFDYYNSYPWCKTGIEDSHPLVTKVHNWEEVEKSLNSFAVMQH